MPFDRPGWNDVWMDVADTIAKRSLCVRSQAGAVIVARDQRVLATSYNGPPPGFPHQQVNCSHWCPRSKTGGGAAYYDDCVATHAEENALLRAPYPELEGGAIYVTRVPCYGCSKRIASTTLAFIVCRIAPEDKEREPERSIQMLESVGITVVLQQGAE